MGFLAFYILIVFAILVIFFLVMPFFNKIGTKITKHISKSIKKGEDQKDGK
ncbi:hypothetical protein GCM10008931_43640 [Oceanobacillus oncorhynchi subsp. oncorhynchi]